VKPKDDFNGSRSSALAPTVFSVASYNIHQAVGADGRRDRRRIVQVLRNLDADVIGLQEVDTNANGHELFQLDYLARESGLKAVGGPTMRRRDLDYGNVLLTRRKILAVRKIDLSVPRREPRGAIDVHLEIGGIKVRVIVTHFGLSPRERRLQAQTLADLVCEKRDELTVVLGDANEWHRYGRASRHMARHFGRCQRLRTFPSWLPVLALDRIWVWPEQALIETCVHRQSPARSASDHLPIRATITTAFCTQRLEVRGQNVSDQGPASCNPAEPSGF